MTTITEKPEAFSLFLNCFTFRLAKGIKLRNENDKYKIISTSPMRIISINRALYELINQLITGHKLYELIGNKPASEKKSISISILSLISKGYLELECTHECSGVENYPFVTVVIPVKDRRDEIRDCLNSLAQLDYPQDKLEIIVVDDGSTDDTAQVVGTFDVRLIRQPISRGPAFCRNIGVKEANGEIVAFIDSDCTSNPVWLKQLIPYFAFDGIGAIGGFVKNYYSKSQLDKYESVCSSLNMGNRILFDRDSRSSFYVPTCNLLVRKDIFNTVNGFKDGMHLGEDVDFCWRMRNLGHFLIYVPTGTVAHKHRNELSKMLKRKYEYGTSESDLYNCHNEKEKVFPAPIYATLSFIVLLLMGIYGKPILISIILVLICIEYISKLRILIHIKEIELKPITLLWAIVKNTFSTYYYFSFHIIRYYIIPVTIICLLFPPVWKGMAIILLIPAVVNYYQKKPEINFFSFLIFFIMEHLSYQIGVFAGCLKIKSFRCYSLRFKM